MLNAKILKLTWMGCLTGCLISNVASQEHNKLTAAETKAKYDLLFNGTDFSGWHAYRLNQVTDTWGIRSNAPLGPRMETVGTDKKSILTNKQYKNFDLKVDVQTPADGNSGIFVRYEETAKTEGNFRSGPELQVCGPSNSDCTGDTKHFGSSYDMFGVKESIRNTWYNPPGQWNQIRIVAYDSNYVHYGNGKKLLEYKIGTPAFIQAYNNSKYASDGNNGRYYHIHPGGILLQQHGEQGITYRNLKAKELPIHPFLREFPDGKWPDNLPQDYVFGKRGCTNPEATNFDPTAEVEDNSGCITAGIKSAQHPALSAVSVVYGASGTVMVSISAKHSDFSVARIDGRSVPHSKIAEGVYSISRQSNISGIVLARFKSGENLLTKIVNLQ